MPRCLSEGVDIFLKSVKRQGESGHDVRVSRSAPWMARVGGPVMMRTAVSLFIRKFTSGDLTSRHVYRMLREFSVLKYKVPCYTFGFHDLGICNRTSFSYPQTFLSVGISGKTSFLYPQTFHSVGISNETSFSYPQTFHSVGISNETSFSYPQTFLSVGISNKTSFSYPQTFHSVGISNKTSC